MTLAYLILSIIGFMVLGMNLKPGAPAAVGIFIVGLLLMVGLGAVSQREAQTDAVNSELIQLRKVCIDAGLATLTPTIVETRFQLLAPETGVAEAK